MRKKLLSLLLACTMVLSFAACAEEDEDLFAGAGEKETQETMKETQETKESETALSVEETVETVEIETTLEGWANSVKYNDQIVLLNENGYAADAFTMEDVCNADFLTEDQKEIISMSSYKCNYGNYLIFQSWGYQFEDGVDRLIAINPIDETYTYIMNDQNYDLDSCEVYQNLLYVTCTDPADYTIKSEKVFDLVEGSFVELEENPTQDLLNQYEGFNFSSTRQHASYTAMLEEDGCLISGSSGSYTVIYPDGSSVSVELNENAWISNYNAKYISYSFYDYDTYNTFYYIYDIATGEEVLLPDGVTEVYFWDNMICTVKNESAEYGASYNVLYEMIPSTGAFEEITSAADVPGMSESSSIYSGLQYIDGKIYFIREEGTTAEWYMTKNTDAGFSEEKLNVTYAEYDIFHYGTVEYLSNRYICEECGYEYGDVYVEGFVCTLDYPAVETVNEKLNELMYSIYDGACDTVFGYEYDQEENHEESWCTYTDDVSVSAVSLLGTHYLAVTLSGYDYAGGAHGYPYLEQFIYDLNSGEQVVLTDLYQGTEEELRELIADKTVEDYESYVDEEYPPYFGPDSDSVYNDAYECCMYGAAHIFDENGLVVEFYPYNMGPYASGFIEVSISYDELGFSFD